MSVVTGVKPGTPTEAAEPRHIGTWTQACDLRPGMHVRGVDGRWGVVAGEPVLGSLGRVTVPVWLPWHLVVDAAGDLEPEHWSWGWRRLVRARTPEQQRQYMEAVTRAAAEQEGTK